MRDRQNRWFLNRGGARYGTPHEDMRRDVAFGKPTEQQRLTLGDGPSPSCGTLHIKSHWPQKRACPRRKSWLGALALSWCGGAFVCVVCECVLVCRCVGGCVTCSWVPASPGRGPFSFGVSPVGGVCACE